MTWDYYKASRPLFQVYWKAWKQFTPWAHFFPADEDGPAELYFGWSVFQFRSYAWGMKFNRGYRPGRYQNRCGGCGGFFFGDKRAFTCRSCSTGTFDGPQPDGFVMPQPLPDNAYYDPRRSYEDIAG